MLELQRSRPALALALALATAACHEPFSNEDLEFLKALPTKEQVALDVPGTTTSTSGLRAIQGLAARAKHYDDAKRTSDQLNGVSAFVLSIVDEVQSYPPTARDGDKRVWGPFPGDGGIELMMSMERVATSTIVKTTSTSTAAAVEAYFEYVLAGRRAGTEAWSTLFAGRYAPSDVLAEGMGAIFVDFEAVRALGGTDVAGLVYVAYDNRFGQQTIEMAIDLAGGSSVPFEEAEAGYWYRAAPTGEKQFVFAYTQNIADLVPDTGPETFIVAVRFLADQRGRADVAVQDGDLGGRVFFEIECWDEAFLRTFLGSNVPGSVPEGALDACAPELRGPFGE
ncbi:hypothetical protein L6R52_23065 [Myxococcota bacterium]|nr:hypothetical protein [Myxococcota bacterium]